MDIKKPLVKADQIVLNTAMLAINTIESQLPSPSQESIRPTFARVLGYAVLAGIAAASFKTAQDLDIGLNPIRNLKILSDQVR